ncbi:hypothetical protein SE17_26840, partial [Kouleothrix aurantiaca]
YYIWFDTGSWDRAKTDLPQLGAYSSDDRAVMEQHVRWAKAAGIGGFIVSWKSTPTLNRRLQQLIDVAKQEQFKLVLIYQGLDFDRNPLPASRVAADLDFFAQTYAAEPVFDVFGRPAVIWSGTWKFSRDEIAQVAGPRRKSMLLLASERNEDDYRRIADLVDGDAYYWSSVNPATFPRYQGKLDDMAKAVHERGGLWIAPAASGFDARLIGGTQVVERNAAGAGERFNFELRFPPDFPPVHADYERTRQVLENLVSNAVKYSPEGGTIRVAGRITAEHAVVSVSDQGIGIPPEEQGKLFRRFYRVDNRLRRETQGAGLGLFLARAFVEAQGGRIWVESQPGRGSRFSFTVPLATPQLPDLGEDDAGPPVAAPLVEVAPPLGSDRQITANDE